MVKRASIGLGLGMAGILAALGAWQWMAARPAAGAVDGNRFEFAVVESFDAQYLGDTPGHIGRGGGLGKTPPNLAIGDPVYRGNVRIGKISRLVWDRTRESLEIEFDPVPFDVGEEGQLVSVQRIAVGETVWAPMGGRPVAARPR